MQLLHIDSSILGEASASRRLSAELVAGWQRHQPELQVRYRDLVTDAIDHLSGATLAASGTPAELRTAEQHLSATLSEAVLQEFLASDIVVIGAPMYNFAVPSQLRAWIDRIVVAGKTFRYGANGPEGLAGGKRVVIVSTAGGEHAGTPAAAAHEDYLRAVLGFIGIRDVEVIHAQGLAMGAARRDAAFAGARRQIDELFALA